MKRLILALTGLGGILLSTQSMGASLPNPKNYPEGAPTVQCVQQAAYDHNVPFVMLLAVNSVERGNTGQYVGNTNGTKDIGAFQINTIHLPRARKMGATHEDLAKRGCYNAQFAAMLLSEALNQPKKQHLDVYSRGAGYHSWTPKYNAIYRKKLERYTKQWHDWMQSQAQIQQPTMNNGLTPVSYNQQNPFAKLAQEQTQRRSL